MRQSFVGCVCVVTGANRGIGLALVKELLAQGATVHAGVRNPHAALDLQAQVHASEGRLFVHALDVARDESVGAFAQSLPQGVIDLVINNAGVNLDGAAKPNTVSAKIMMSTFDINTLGPMRVAQALLARLELGSQGCVANISSAMGSIADNGQGGVMAYRTSKTALNMVTKCMALANPKIVFLAMHPGWVLTDMGGPSAPISVEASARGLLAQMAAAGPNDSGSFVRFDGHKAPW